MNLVKEQVQHLVLCNPELQQTMTAELQEIRDKINAAHMSNLEEIKRTQDEARANLLLQKRAAAKKKAAATKNAKAKEKALEKPSEPAEEE